MSPGEVFAWVFQGGNLEQDVTSVALTASTGKTIDSAVPTGKRWIVESIKICNADTGNNRTITVYFFKEAAATNLIGTLGAFNTAASTCYTTKRFSGDQDELALPFPLKGGNIIRITWSAGSGGSGTTADGLVICYRELDE